ncbi:uncharacterized protein LOC141714848 [Apium graveolens]|uniref:uncharacterized protein LOC141714848 n=1 Tax=Apium graveolens TaxID=4045 RepID=UPI003D790294
MESAVFNLIEDLDQSTTNWKIKARVTRMWTNVSFENGSVKGYNVILLDDDNNHVHAFAYPNIWNGFKTPAIKEAFIFSQYTTVTTVEDDGMIPAYIFEFLDLGDLFAEASKYQPQQQPEFAISIIGVIEDFEPLTKLDTKFGMRDIVKFRICDSSNQHKVNVWGDLDVLANNIYNKELQSPVIAIITNTKVTTFMNTVQIGTLPSSKLYLNLDDESVTDMRMSFRIMVLAEDDTFSCNVMLMDRAARRIALEEGLPQSPSPSESAHISESSSINFSVNSVDLDAIDHTLGSAKSVTKKIKKEK